MHQMQYPFFWFWKISNCLSKLWSWCNSLLTNVSRRGRPPKILKPENNQETKDMEIQDIEVEDTPSPEEVDSEESNVDDIVEIERETDS